MEGGAQGAGRRVPVIRRRPEAGPHAKLRSLRKVFRQEGKEFYVQPIRRAVPWSADLSQVAHAFHSIRGIPPSRCSAGSGAGVPVAGEGGLTGVPPRSPAVRMGGGALSGPFCSSERAPRPTVPVRNHPGWTSLALGGPGMGAFASRLTENRLVPDGMGCGPPSRALGGHSPLNGRASGPQSARCGRRAPPAPAPAREKPPEGWRGAAAGSPWATPRGCLCRAADADRRRPRGSPASARGGIWERHFHGARSPVTSASRGLSLFVLEGDNKRRKNPWGTQTAVYLPPFSFL